MATRPKTTKTRGAQGAKGGKRGRPASLAARAEARAIELRGVRQNNLANLDLSIPKHRLVAVTGVSGSGKSSLAFDTLFREGQRRFLETLSAYARQFLGRMEKPDLDHVDGLAPAIAVDQRAVQRGPRSTVGTLTEISDHLRVMYARAGLARCPEHGHELASQTPETIVRLITEGFAGQKLHLLAPLVRDRKGQHKALLADLTKRGVVRVRVDGTVMRIEEVPELERYKRHSIEAVVDRLVVGSQTAGSEPDLARLRESLGQALELGEGDIIALGEADEQGFSTSRSCPECGREAPPLEPRLFSFNSPHGACPDCDGMGVQREPSIELLVPDGSLTIRDGALAVTRKSGGALTYPNVDFSFLERIGESFGFDLDTPWEELEESARQVVLFGSGAERFTDTATWNGKRYQGEVRWERRYKGVIPAIEQALSKGGRRRKLLERYLHSSTCSACAGSRLCEAARAVRVGGAEWGLLQRTPIAELEVALDALKLTKRESLIADPLLLEVRRRLAFLQSVGLGYLSLERSADSLSSGEAQRIRLAAQLGAGLQGVLYVLDEPSIGLHARDHGKLLGALFALRDQGNSVLVVEHDEATLRAADHLIDIGPGAGRHGGTVVSQGTPAEVARADSPTGRLLRGELDMPAPKERRTGNGNWLELRGAKGYHLKSVNLRLPLGCLTAITGVSGSGKSTLINRTLHPAMLARLEREGPAPLPFKRLVGADAVHDMIVVDASPIGRTPRSNPATYTGAFGPIRDLFSQLPEAKLRGWLPGRFSFNVEGGRCEACGGAGSQLVELQFLAPVTVDCEECGGKRFNEETLAVRYRGRSIADVLELPVEEAYELFRDLPKIARPLAALVDVGVGYLSLGQPSTTLSGGEAQRIKLAKFLQRSPRDHALFLLDEPTTGLAGEDVGRLLGALQRLVDAGHSVVVIEHDLDVVRAADWVVDLGPLGGEGGGQLVAAGLPEEIEACAESHTGRALAGERLAKRQPLSAEPSVDVAPVDRLRVVGAETHNLRGVDVDLPRNGLCVITGPSGSGKSSLALDTIHAAGQKRFVESLSTYARQFLAARDRPPVERIEGLGPSVAVEARTALGSPRSTVATTTELHDHLRVLYARAGTRRCPKHGEALATSGATTLAKRFAQELDGESGWVLAPIVGGGAPIGSGVRESWEENCEAWLKAGYARVMVDGEESRLERGAPPSEDANTLDLVLDRMGFGARSRTRLAEALESCQSLSEGRAAVVLKDGRRFEGSTRGACKTCGFQLEGALEPRHFSFNAHVGACPDCDGLGSAWQCSSELLVSDRDLPLVMGEPGTKTAIAGKLGRYLTKGKGYYENLLRTVAKAHRIDLGKPLSKLTPKQQALLLHGEGAREVYRVEIEKKGANFEMEENFTAGWEGLCGAVDAWHRKSEDPEWRSILEKVMERRTCKTCAGERLAPAPRAVTIGGRRLPEVLCDPIEAATEWLAELVEPDGVLAGPRGLAVEPVVAELRSRAGMLDRVGLGYLTLDRSVSTLSGGEARRVRLAASLGSQLTGVCYVLDEPTVGLHASDIDRLVDALCGLRDLGNTVLVVEHDEQVIRRADWIVDMGPGSGRFGGTVVASGTLDQVAAHPEAPTARLLRGELELRGIAGRAPALLREELPAPSRSPGVRGAKLRNLKRPDIDLQFGQWLGVCGPSGSGKSTLILETLVPALRGESPNGRWARTVGSIGAGIRVVVADAAPIGRSPASVPATASGVMEPLRDCFARLPEGRMRGFTKAHFSFNSSKGRCPACDGRGATQVEMQFLSDLWLECEECDGRRYRPEVLDVRYRGKNMAEVLEMSVSEALEFFEHQPAVAAPLRSLEQVGLGYLALGQSSTTLSGGEAQRIKLAAELQRAETGARSVIVLDEPSTGLHATDLVPLAQVLRGLVDRGDAVVMIEHHTGLLAACDRLVELGPAGGAAGGVLIASGSPEDLADDPNSVTGPWLRESLRNPSAGRQGTPGGKRVRSQKPAAKTKQPPKRVSKKARRRATGSSGSSV